MYTLHIWYADGRLEARPIKAESASIELTPLGTLILKTETALSISAQYIAGVRKAELVQR